MADHDRLKDLHTALVDTMAGYDKALEAAEADVRPTLEKVRALHEAAHHDVHGMLTAAGERPDDDGSFMTTVHKAVIGARAAIVGIDEGSLSSFASGEENNLSKYDEAIGSEPAAADALRRHRDALANAIADMKREAG